MDRYCDKCKGKVVAHAFSEGDCTLCSDLISTSHTPCDKVCERCSFKENVCMSCGNVLALPYGKITLEKIKEAVEYVFDSERNKPKKERVIKFTTYCRGLGAPVTFSTETLGGPPFCNHPECSLCRNVEKAFEEEIKNFEWKPEVWHGEKRGDLDYYFDIPPKYPEDPTEMRMLETYEELSAKEIIEKYGDLLSEEQLKQLKKYE